MAATNETSVLNRDYAERQLIIVTSDVMAQAVDEIGPTTEKDDLKGNWKSAQRSFRQKDWTGMADALLNLYAQLDPGITGAALAADAIRAWAKAGDNGIPILRVGKTAAKEIAFPPGHPRTGVLYIGHPALARAYYPMADFHRVVFEQKFCEAVELLMSLGATKIRVEHVAGWSKDFSARLSIPLGVPSETIALEGKTTGVNRKSLLYEASLPGSDSPKVPDGLVWYAHERTWQTVAKGRIDFGLSDFSLNVTYEDDFGVNAGLKTTVAKAGLDLGGKFEDHQSTVWRLEGTFKVRATHESA
jgi:hypothetical protein